jgi:hypothetical protein
MGVYSIKVEKMNVTLDACDMCCCHENLIFYFPIEIIPDVCISTTKQHKNHKLFTNALYVAVARRAIQK